MQALTIDTETRSAVSIKRSSYRRYASHRTTNLLSIACQWVNEPHAKVYRPAQGAVFTPQDMMPSELRIAVENGIPIYAHNKPFDARILYYHCHKRLGWTEIPEELWRCSMALCSYYAIPRKLKEAAKALALPVQKDMEGNKVMHQLASPKKWTLTPLKMHIKRQDPDWKSKWRTDKALSEHCKDLLQNREYVDRLPILWDETPAKLEKNAEYCRTDVEVQTLLLRTLGPLPDDRLKDWQFDQMINERGVQVDVLSLLSTSMLIERELELANTRVAELTKDTTGVPAVETVGQIEKIRTWLSMMGVDTLGLTKDDVASVLHRDDISERVREVLSLRASAGKASIKKVAALLDNVDEDYRARDALVWHKASTGRWAGRAWQPHNFPRDCYKPKEAEEFHRAIREEADAVGCLTAGANRVEFFDAVSMAMRSYLTAKSGHRLLVSDFASIEARVLAWLAGCQTLLDRFYANECVYSFFASRIYGREITGKGPERQLGKVAVLGLGYQMGEEKFIQTASSPPYSIAGLDQKQTIKKWNRYRKQEEWTEQTMGKIVVDLFRSTFKEIPQFWSALQETSIQAVSERKTLPCGRLQIGCTPDGQWMFVVLPSGRAIWYREPRLTQKPNRWNSKRVDTVLSYMTVDSKTSQWVRKDSYGGLAAENATQAVAADLLKEAMQRVEANGYPAILSVHDEVIAESNRGSKDEFHSLMKVVPDWATGCPVEAETHEADRYGK